ncbi:MAG: hypothetical protein WDN49_17725 [Acetobacteraceae bacterium]
MRTADWWLANVPPSLVAFWDFSDPAIPNTETIPPQPRLPARRS